MKKIGLLPALLLALTVGTAQAQADKKTDKAKSADKVETNVNTNASVRVNVEDEGDGTRVRVEKGVNGKTEIIERTFSDQAAADRFLDSVNVGTGNKMRINVNGNRNGNVRGDNGTYSIRAPKAPRPPRVRVYGDSDLAWDSKSRAEFERDMQKFGRDMERWGREYGEKMKNWGQQFERDFKYNWQPEMNLKINRSLDNLNRLDGVRLFDGNGTTSSRTVKSLNAYPNQPSNGRLNVTFQAPEKGDVTITVTDINGKEVAREKVRDFSGKYVGQVDLKRGADKGTYFLTVTQGNDGAVKRLVIE